MDLKCTNIFNDLYTYQNGFTMYKDTQWCVHISQWIYNVQRYTMMCTHIKMGLRCTNIHNGVYTSQWMYNVQIYTMVCTHITMNVQAYTRICTHITMDLQFTTIHNDVHTYHNRCTIYKHTQWCAHISQWMYNVQTYTMIDLISIFGVLIPLSAIFQLYHGGQF